ncbi:hypothetical protein A3C87_02100 [Candidatus Kaiserbacteria bacterium RIFCSPHIGHO2_02_FULL_49_34]|uniref:Spermidine/putrescine ABC transporter substrate-binding protein n=1 Tax=Candidatus Kaiserbacteria bacterium RIFCSPHIGHO2_02_FULL_49_34 TaxID=1798491 RepID=A0A1F6DHY3_9BACT|nr:MAG: hypothetical protein A3C87_02100 [Candidatus Kaiserbacteria bacterium RIFCSPHIGHO2_02_FULL_49_34]
MKKLTRFRIHLASYITVTLLTVLAVFLSAFAFAKPTELHIYTWEDYIAPEVIAQFETKYNVVVTVTEFDSEFDLLRMYRETPKLDTYDLIFFSDTIAEELRRKNVLAPIQKKSITNIRNISASLFDIRTNAEALHAVPYMYGTTGIVVNTKFIDPSVVTWQTLFDPQYAGKTCLLNDESEVIAAAALAQGFDAIPTSDAAMHAVTGLVKNYTEYGTYCGDVSLIDELVSERVWIAQQWNGSAIPALEEHEHLRYILPPDGARIWYDYMGIPTGARNVHQASRFIQYLNEPKVAAQNVNYLWYASVNQAAREFVDTEILENEIIYPRSDTKNKFTSYAAFPYYEAVATMRDTVYTIMHTGSILE